MAQQVTINYLGMEGIGTNVTRAKQDAARKIETALSGNWTPFFLNHQGWIGIVCRTNLAQLAWGYKLLQPATDQTQSIYLSSHYASREEAVCSAAWHIAQNAGTYAGLEQWITPPKQRELDDYFAWQAEYATAKAQGHSDEKCWEMATAARAGR